MKQVLFYTRLLLYLLALAIPLIHPAVVVPFDRVGLIFWFFLIPLEMLTASTFPPVLRKSGLLSQRVQSWFSSSLFRDGTRPRSCLSWSPSQPLL